MQKLNVNSLIFDYSLYPRQRVDDQHVSQMVESMKANIEFPPVVIDKKSRRIIDGFHRVTAKQRYYKLFKDEKPLIDVVLKSYSSEAEMFLDAMKYNASHGRMLSQSDRAHCIIKAEQLGLSIDITSEALSITCEKYDELKTTHIGELHVSSHIKTKKGRRATFKTESIPLKNTIRHKAGKEVTAKQVEVNKKLSGMDQSFYVNQIILLIESDLLNIENEYLMQRLEKLQELLETVLVKI